MSNYREESIAFALATGIAPGINSSDRDARRARWARRKSRLGGKTR
ncbi:hypothetical protein SAMN03159338_1486 [Sphingomonas sp. NFR04]|jgi:hypothetical protein|nr:hypothetical protein SAMN03159338_1486 [Sphingomonas sp. NFR04]